MAIRNLLGCKKKICAIMKYLLTSVKFKGFNKFNFKTKTYSIMIYFNFKPLTYLLTYLLTY